jgi:hypothetical protein
MARVVRRMPKPGRLLAGTLVLAAVPWSAGCGKSQARPDGGDGSVTIGDAPVLGRRAFDVIAVLKGDGGFTNLPPTSSFTLVLDAAAGLAIAGANGRGAIVGVTSSDGRTFHSAGTFDASSGEGTECNGATNVRYDNFEFTVANGGLTGTANGSAFISCGDCVFTVPFGATLTGTADATPPTLRSSGFLPANPFDVLGLSASEPLPAGTTARLVGDDGTAIDLIPTIADGIEPLVLGFSKPNVILHAGQGYGVTLDGLIDFAGLKDRSGVPLRVASFGAAPAVPEDGFESATGSVLGGAMVMTAGALPAIAGNTSLYIGGKGAPGLDAASGRSLAVRLSRQAGDTKLRFSYRAVALQAQSGFLGALRVGSEGGAAGSPAYSFAAATASQMITVAGQTAYISAAAVVETPLPGDATDDVLLIITPTNFSCGPALLNNTGLLLDDLRLE